MDQEPVEVLPKAEGTWFPGPSRLVEEETPDWGAASPPVAGEVATEVSSYTTVKPDYPPRRVPIPLSPKQPAVCPEGHVEVDGIFFPQF